MKTEDISWVLELREMSTSRLKLINPKRGSHAINELKRIDMEMVKRAGKVKFKNLS